MKTNVNKFLLSLLSICSLLFSSVRAQEKLIVLNEGMWQADNGRLTYFEGDHVVSNQWFRDNNGKKIGDTPNDIIQVNDNLIAIAVNWSNIVQFITPEGKAVAATEDIPNNRKLCSDGKYVYVTSYGHECTVVGNASKRSSAIGSIVGNASKRSRGVTNLTGTLGSVPHYSVTPAGTLGSVPHYFDRGFVAKIDVATFQVVAATEVGYEPEGIAFYKGHLFVANTGGYALQEDHEFETTVSIINAETMQVERTVDTHVPNLFGKMSQSGRYLCINSPGDYYETTAASLIFDCQKALDGDANCYVKLDVPATYNCTTRDGHFLAIGSSFSFLTGDYEFSYLNIDPKAVMESGQQGSGITQSLPGSLLADYKKMNQPYGIYVNPYTGYIYGTDAGSYEGVGYLYQWSPEGQLLGKHKVYINPGHFLALPPDGHFDIKPLKGDVNGDGSVDVADISSVISVMADNGQWSTADVNEDGTVDVADISAIITIMANME